MNNKSAHWNENILKIVNCQICWEGGGKDVREGGRERREGLVGGCVDFG